MDHTVSGLENLARDFFKETLPTERVLYNERLPWLSIFNPSFKKKTVRELDIYFPDLNVGIEVNGSTHSHAFVRRVDNKKQALCKKNGVVLYHVWTAVDFWELRYEFSKLYPEKIAPEISEDLRTRLERYSNNGSYRHNVFRQNKLFNEVNVKIREEEQKKKYALKTKRPKRYREHLHAKEKAMQREKRKYREQELAYALDE